MDRNFCIMGTGGHMGAYSTLTFLQHVYHIYACTTIYADYYAERDKHNIRCM